MQVQTGPNTFFYERPADAPPAPDARIDDTDPWRYGLSKYERTAVIAFRVEQLSRGAPARVPVPANGLPDLFVVAERELDAGLVDVEVVRRFPDGSVERVPVADAVRATQ